MKITFTVNILRVHDSDGNEIEAEDFHRQQFFDSFVTENWDVEHELELADRSLVYFEMLHLSKDES